MCKILFMLLILNNLYTLRKPILTYLMQVYLTYTKSNSDGVHTFFLDDAKI